jgi:hypothetical protein
MWTARVRDLNGLLSFKDDGGQPMEFRSHMLRDTFAVEMLLARVPNEEVSRLLTHKSIRVTENITPLGCVPGRNCWINTSSKRCSRWVPPSRLAPLVMTWAQGEDEIQTARPKRKQQTTVKTLADLFCLFGPTSAQSSDAARRFSHLACKRRIRLPLATMNPLASYSQKS